MRVANCCCFVVIENTWLFGDGGGGGGVENPGMDFDDLSFKLKGKKKLFLAATLRHVLYSLQAHRELWKTLT